MSDARPILAVVTPFLTPFRVQFIERAAREMPDLQFRVFVTQNPDHGPWDVRAISGAELLHLARNKPWQHAEGLRASLGPDLATSRALLDDFREHPPSAIFLVGYAYPSHLRLILWAHRRIPLLLWGDSNALGDTARGIRGALKKLLLTRIIKRCAAVLPCGESGRQFFARYGARPDRTFLCPADPDYRLIDSPNPETLRAVAERYSFPASRRRLVCCARLVQLKRFDSAIDAFVSIADDRPDWDLVIVGDGEMRDAWRARVPQRFARRVIWTGFLKDPAETAAVYRHSHVFVHPGDFEAWGVVVLEAAAAGLAMIVSNVVGAAVDMVRPGRNGSLVAPGDVAEIALAMREWTDPAALERARGESLTISREFREKADAIRGLRAALIATGAITAG